MLACWCRSACWEALLHFSIWSYILRARVSPKNQEMGKSFFFFFYFIPFWSISTPLSPGQTFGPKYLLPSQVLLLMNFLCLLASYCALFLRLLNFGSEFKSFSRWTLILLVWEWAVEKSARLNVPSHPFSSVLPWVGQEAGGTQHSFHCHHSWANLTSEWKWNCFDFAVSLTPVPCPVHPSLPPLLVKVSYETEKSCWRLTSFH